MMEQETIVWKGYLACFGNDSCVIQSPWMLNNDCVFGADSDHTTLAVAAIQLMQSKGCNLNSINALQDVEASIITMTTGVEVLQTLEDESVELSADWDLCIGDDARVVICKTDSELELWQPEGTIDVDVDFHQEITAAWQRECAPNNVSQGAYISKQQYYEGADARLNLMGQELDGEMIWPP